MTAPSTGWSPQLVADQCAANPTLGSVLGLTEYDEALPDMSAAGIEARERAEDGWVGRLRALADAELSADERIDRDLALMVLRGRELMRDWADWRRSPDHYAGTALSAVFVLLTTRLRPEPELATAVAARLRGTPALLDQGMTNLDPALAHPALLRRALGQIAAGAVYARTVADEFADEESAALVRDAGELAAAAFERFGEHVEALVEKATGEWADRRAALRRAAEGGRRSRLRHPRAARAGTGCLRRAGRGHDGTGPGAARHRRLPRGGQELQRRPSRLRRRRCWRCTGRPPTRLARSASSTSW